MSADSRLLSKVGEEELRRYGFVIPEGFQVRVIGGYMYEIGPPPIDYLAINREVSE